MSKNRIIATRSANNVTVIVNGESFYIKEETKEEALALYKTVLKYKADGTEEAVKTLKELLAPTYKMETSFGKELTRDRRGNYFLGGFKKPLPLKFLETVKETLEDDLPIQGLMNFWKLLMLNEDEHVKDSLFKFMDRFKMPITDNGYFIAYKSVAWKGVENEKLGIFISQKYVDFKANGKSTEGLIVVQLGENSYALETPEDFEAYKNKFVESKKQSVLDDIIVEYLQENHKALYTAAKRELATFDELLEFATSLGFENTTSDQEIEDKVLEEANVKIIGELDELFANISSMFEYDSPTFTDFHTRKSTIELGKPVSMPREDCDNDPYNTCSSGLHVGAPGYVSKFGYSSSRYILACLVNPMNVVAIPHDYDFEKMRTCEYLPYAVCEMKDGAITELDTNYFEEDYINYEKSILETELSELDFNNEEEAEKATIIRSRLVDISTEGSSSDDEGADYGIEDVSDQK